MTYDQIIAVLRDHADNHVLRIRWTGGEWTAIVTTGELREALADCEIDTAEIESLEFLSVHLKAVASDLSAWQRIAGLCS
jgi:hypothetical protein